VDTPTVFEHLTAQITHLREILPDIGLTDTFSFGQVWGSRGQKALLFADQLKAYQAERESKPPPIQLYLKQAREMKKRLDSDPTLTHNALATELGVTRFEIIRTLNLLKLAPEVQEFILSLPPTTTRRFPISKRSLRSVSTRNPARQLREFQRLIPSQPITFKNNLSHFLESESLPLQHFQRLKAGYHRRLITRRSEMSRPPRATVSSGF